MYGYVLVWYILSSSQLYNSLHTQGFFPLSILKGKYFLTTLTKGKKIFKVNIYFGENCMVLKKFFKEKGPFLTVKEIIPRKGAFKLLKKEKKPWHHLGDMAIPPKITRHIQHIIIWQMSLNTYVLILLTPDYI